jgi:hypothetical protein
VYILVKLLPDGLWDSCTIRVTSYPDDVMCMFTFHVYIYNNLIYLVPFHANLFIALCLCHLPFPLTWNRTVGPNARVFIHIEHCLGRILFSAHSIPTDVVHSCLLLGSGASLPDKSSLAQESTLFRPPKNISPSKVFFSKISRQPSQQCS